MSLPEGQKGLFAGTVSARDAVEINLDIAHGTTLVDGLWEAFRPGPYQPSVEDNPGMIAEIDNRRSQHD